MATYSSSCRAPKERGPPPRGVREDGFSWAWVRGRESSHSADARHSEAGFVAFGQGGEKGGNVRNILTQQSSPPPPAQGWALGRTDC